MVKTIQGSYTGAGKKIAIVASRFNDFLVQSLLRGAEDCLIRHGVKEDDIFLFRVPGAFDIPPVANKLATESRFHAVICLGVVIRGDTAHFQYVAGEAAKGIARAGLTGGVPVVFGVITAETIEQAIERSGTKAGNRGADAAGNALELIDLYQQIAEGF